MSMQNQLSIHKRNQSVGKVNSFVQKDTSTSFPVTPLLPKSKEMIIAPEPEIDSARIRSTEF